MKTIFVIAAIVVAAFYAQEADANHRTGLLGRRSASCGAPAVTRTVQVVRVRERHGLFQRRAGCAGTATAQAACGGAGMRQAEKIAPKK